LAKASAICSGDICEESKVMVAWPGVNSTATLSTPGCFLMMVSTVRTQPPHVIPLTKNIWVVIYFKFNDAKVGWGEGIAM